MSRVVILLLCALCTFAQDTVKIGPPIPETTPNPLTSTTTSKPTTTSPTTTTTPATTTTKKTTTSPTTAPTTTTTKKTTTSPTTTPTTKKPTPSPKPTPDGPPAINNFTGNYTHSKTICLMMKMAVQFEMFELNPTMINITDEVEYNVTCDTKSQTETLVLFWDKNNVTFSFYKNESKYEIQSILAFIVPPGGNITAYYHNKSEFPVSTKQSYKCAKDQPLNLTDSSNETLARIHVSHVQYQAFMNTTAAEYDSAWYCDATNTPDVVPVVVGCILAVLVVLVLVAYLFGRRRCQARGYLSMFTEEKNESDYIPMKSLSSCFK